MEDDLSYSKGIQPRNPIEGLFMLIRPVESIFVGLALIIAYFMAIPNLDGINVITMIFIFISGYFISAQGMVHNDIVDIDIDRVNAPHRTLPSGVIPVSFAWWYVGFLATISLLFAVLIDLHTQRFPFSTVYCLIFILLLDSYNFYFKKKGIIGNIIIGFAVMNLFIYTDFLVNFDNYPKLSFLPLSAGLYAFFVNIGREIIKAMSDVEGDAKKQVKSLPVTLGFKNAGILGSALIIIGMLSSLPNVLIPAIRDQFALVPIILFLIEDLLMMLLLLKLWRSFTPKNAFWVKERIFYVMMAYLVPFLVQVIINFTTHN